MTTTPDSPPVVPDASIGALLSPAPPRRGARRAAPGTVRLVIGGTLLAGLIAASILVPVLTGIGVNDQSVDSYLVPSAVHPFGTDEVGRDVFARSFYGLRLDLLLIFIAVPISMSLGTLLGMLRASSVVLGELGQRLIDIILGFPAVVLGISIAAIMGPGFLSLLLALIISGLPPFGRLARSSLLSLESRDFVQAARGFGASRTRILLRHYLPNSAVPLLTQLAISFVNAVMLEASLSVIGLGLQPPTPTLGGLISAGLRNIYTQAGYVVGPTLLLIVLAISLSLLSDGLKDRMTGR